jgi:5'-nucleotidase
MPLRPGTLLNINVPHGAPAGVALSSIGKRIYRDELTLQDEAPDGRRRYRVYGTRPGFHDVPGTDVAAVAAGRIAVTPIHFDLTDRESMDALAGYDLERLLTPAARGRE